MRSGWYGGARQVSARQVSARQVSARVGLRPQSILAVRSGHGHLPGNLGAFIDYLSEWH
jgi:hypothetical protein